VKPSLNNGLLRSPFLWLVGGGILLFFSTVLVLFPSSTRLYTGISGVSLHNGDSERKKLGRYIFRTNCLICHQASGQGSLSLYPPLAKSEWVLARGSHSKEHLILILLHGLQGPIVVRGSVYDGYMSGWSHLSDSEIAAVLSYICTEWDNLATPITSQMVATVRKNVPRTRPWTWNELRAVHPDGKRNVKEE
jgi:mono/diheme cytochrome c family protein